MNLVFGGDVIVRPLCSKDAEWIYHGMQDPEVSKWLLSAPYPYTREDADEFINKRLEGRGYGEFAYSIVRPRRDCSEGLGCITLEADPSGSHELGYWLLRKEWGKGVAYQALQDFVKGACKKHPDLKVFANVEPENVRSIALLKRLGMEYVKTHPFVSTTPGKRTGETIELQRYQLSNN